MAAGLDELAFAILAYYFAFVGSSAVELTDKFMGPQAKEQGQDIGFATDSS